MIRSVSVLLLALAICNTAHCDFLAAFEWAGVGQKGTVLLLSSNGGSHLWAVCGPTDTDSYFMYPVRVEPGLQLARFIGGSATVFADLLDQTLIVRGVYRGSKPWEGVFMSRGERGARLYTTYREGKAIGEPKLDLKRDLWLGRFWEVRYTDPERRETYLRFADHSRGRDATEGVIYHKEWKAGLSVDPPPRLRKWRIDNGKVMVGGGSDDDEFERLPCSKSGWVGCPDEDTALEFTLITPGYLRSRNWD